MRNRKKLLSCILAFALMIPILTTTAFGNYIAEPGSGNYWGYNSYSESELNKYVPVVFHTGDGQSAQSTGYAQFYSAIRNNQYVFEFGVDSSGGVQHMAPTEAFASTGHIKFVLHDGIMIVTNDLTAEETHDMAAEAIANSGVWNPNDVMYDYAVDTYADWLSTANFMNNSASAYAGLTPIRNNPNIETIIFADNVTNLQSGNAFFNCASIKNVI